MDDERRPAPPGSFKKITSLANPLVKDIRALQLKKHRDETGLFIAEGLKLVRDAVDGGWPMHVFAYAAARFRAGDRRARGRNEVAGGTVLEVSAQVLEKITRRDNPQTVIGVFEQRFVADADIGRDGIWVALDRVRDPGNLGTIVRTVDAVGVQVSRSSATTCDPFSRGGGARHHGLDLPRADRERRARTGCLRRRSRHGARLVGTHLSGDVSTIGPPTIDGR